MSMNAIQAPTSIGNGQRLGRRLYRKQILKAGELLKKHKAKTLIVCCDSGSLATSAVRQLKAQGFTQAFNLRGGITAWRSENLPLTKG